MLRRTERGFSLVELMVAMVAGLGVVLCITSLYMALLRTDESLMARIHLQQGLQFLLDSIERDVRRAGYAPATSRTTSSSWPGLYWSTRCVLMGMDMDEDGVLAGEQELRGYRFNPIRQRLEVRSWLLPPADPGVACRSSGWQDMTDGQLQITAFALSRIDAASNLLSMQVTAQDPRRPQQEVHDARYMQLRNW